MADLILPGNPRSEGEALAARYETERLYLDELSPEIEAFILAVFALGRSASPFSFTYAQVSGLWDEAVERATRALPEGSSLPLSMRGDVLPSIAFFAVLGALSKAQEEALSAEKTTDLVRVSLGLERDPAALFPRELDRLGVEGAEYGKVVGPEGSRTVTAASESLARTTATADFGESMLRQLRDEGYTHKRWSTRFDSRVRDTHAAADRQTVPLEQDFIVGSTSMRYPADPNCGDLSEVINCRCVLIGVKFAE